MNKNIRLLVENLFDDEIFDYDEYDQNIEVSKNLFTHKIGDMLYEHKHPYAICCGLAEDFSDNNYRFILYNRSKPYFYDSFTEDMFCLNLFKEYNNMINGFTLFIINNKNDILNLDENGYENTLLLFDLVCKFNVNIHQYPALEYCFKFGSKYYIPAITELQHLFSNYKETKQTYLKNLNWLAYSSTVTETNNLAVIYSSHQKFLVILDNPFYKGYMIPFLKIND